jgi:dihydrofolate synthase/folylpolyglutamate synthase
MGYDAAIDYLYNLKRFGMKLGLENINQLLRSLGEPQKKLKVIHVTGTNGKGSVCAMISSMLKCAGYKVGMYTSPHLVRFTERIQVDGKEIDQKEVLRLFNKIRPFIALMTKESMTKQPTFFEVTTALALLYFVEEKVDFAVVEVGLGGRLDATNVVDPLVCVITHIALEHTEHLGRKIEDIAKEKAGIIKKGVPVVTAENNEKALEVIKNTCKERDCKMIRVGKGIKYEKIKVDINHQEFNVKTDVNEYNNLRMKLLGDHQLVNAATAIGAIELLRYQHIDIPKKAIKEGLLKTNWPARLEVVHRSPLIILDSTHNYNGAKTFRSSLDIFDYKRMILILGILNDKDVEPMIKEIAPLAHTIIATKPKSERAYDPKIIADAAKKYIAKEFIKNVVIEEDVSEAVKHALSTAKKNGLICITGSIYTAGEAKEFLDGFFGDGNNNRMNFK